MDDQNDDGATKRDATKPSNAIIPIAASKNPLRTTILDVPITRRRWFRVTVSCAAVAAIVIFIGALVEIPNSVMNWFINWRQLFKTETASPKREPADYIPGTEITHTQLLENFRFGHAVIYLGGNETLKHEIHTNGLLDWSIAWDNVRIERNVSSGTVHFFMPSVSARKPDGRIIIDDSDLSVVLPLKKWQLSIIGVRMENRPCPYALVLSDDQRSPVFAIGFRIPTERNGLNPQWGIDGIRPK